MKVKKVAVTAAVCAALLGSQGVMPRNSLLVQRGWTLRLIMHRFLRFRYRNSVARRWMKLKEPMGVKIYRLSIDVPLDSELQGSVRAGGLFFNYGDLLALTVQ